MRRSPRYPKSLSRNRSPRRPASSTPRSSTRSRAEVALLAASRFRMHRRRLGPEQLKPRMGVLLSRIADHFTRQEPMSAVKEESAMSNAQDTKSPPPEKAE